MKNTTQRGNWDALVAGTTGLGQHSQLRRLLIRKGTFRYRNGETGAQTNSAAGDLIARTPDSERPIQVTAKGVFQQAICAHGRGRGLC